MKNSLKFILTCAVSVCFATGAVVGTTIGVVHHNNTTGKGGLDTIGLPSLTGPVISQPEDVDLQALLEAAVAESQPAAEAPDAAEPESADHSLSYFSYRVKKGDMISYIASRYNVTTDTIYSANNTITNSRLIQPGQYIKIPSMSGILYTVKKDGETPQSVAEKYDVDAEKCALVNNMDASTELSSGLTIFVPDAQMDWETKLEINGDLFKLPLKRYFYISSRWGWRNDPFGSGRRTYHGGIDMACSKGTPIYAAKAGRVTTAGWSNVYGNYVIVDHGQGYKTLYGHMSKIRTSKGAWVDNNTIIGEVGSTGQSTGPHLHFTVYKNGNSIDPTNVVNFAKR